MKLSAVTQASVLAFVETFDLIPRGSVFYPDLAGGIVEQFRFQNFPQKPEAFDEQKGIEFGEGLWKGTVVEKLVIYWNGILLGTHSSTAESEIILEEALDWASQKFNIAYKPGMLNRKRYLSSLTFYSEQKLLTVHSAISKLASKLHDRVKQITGHELTYEPTRFDVDFCRHERQIPMSPFT